MGMEKENFRQKKNKKAEILPDEKDFSLFLKKFNFF